MYCSYYQAQVNKKDTWFLVSTLRSFEHLVFDRTLDKEKCIIEFFVPEDLEHYFVELLEYFKREHVIFDFQKMENRLLDPSQIV